MDYICCFFFFFKTKTAYDMRISDWSSDVCSSDLIGRRKRRIELEAIEQDGLIVDHRDVREMQVAMCVPDASLSGTGIQQFGMALGLFPLSLHQTARGRSRQYLAKARHARPISRDYRSEEQTSELQYLMRTT